MAFIKSDVEVTMNEKLNAASHTSLYTVLFPCFHASPYIFVLTL